MSMQNKVALFQLIAMSFATIAIGGIIFAITLANPNEIRATIWVAGISVAMAFWFLALGDAS